MDFRNWIPWLWGLEDPAHDGKLVGTDPGRASFAQEPKAVGRQNSFLLKVSQTYYKARSYYVRSFASPKSTPLACYCHHKNCLEEPSSLVAGFQSPAKSTHKVNHYIKKTLGVLKLCSQVHRANPSEESLSQFVFHGRRSKHGCTRVRSSVLKRTLLG